MKSGSRLFLFKILPFLRSLMWENAIIDLGHAGWCLNKWHLTAVCPIQAGTETGFYGPNNYPSEKWERMALRDPFDNGGLFTVLKCKRDLPLSGSVKYSPPSNTCQGRDCSILQANPAFGAVWILNPSWRPQPGFHWSTVIALTDWVKRQKVEERFSFSSPLGHRRCCLCRLFWHSLFICVKKHENVHLALLLWIPFWRVSLFPWQ